MRHFAALTKKRMQPGRRASKERDQHHGPKNPREALNKMLGWNLLSERTMSVELAENEKNISC
jgi:hypothetical protein